MPSLVRFNFILYLIHGISFFFLVGIVCNSKKTWDKGNMKISLFTPIFDKENTSVNNWNIITITISVTFIILFEALFSTVVHGLYAWSEHYHGVDGFYLKHLNHGLCVYRWIEYAISPEIIWVVTCMYVGCLNSSMIAFICVSTVFVMMCGSASESKGKEVFSLLGILIFMNQIAWIGTVAYHTTQSPSFANPLMFFVVAIYMCIIFVRVISIWKQEEIPRMKSEITLMFLDLLVKIGFRFVLVVFVYLGCLMPSLLRLNIGACILHGASFIALVAIICKSKETWDKGNLTTIMFIPIFEEGGKEISSWKIDTTTASVSAMILFEALFTAIAHGLYAFSEFYHGANGFYLRQLNSGESVYRWAEYSVSATLVWLVVSMYAGCRDTTFLGTSAVVVVCVMYCGAVSEMETRQISTVIGGIVFLDLIIWTSTIFGYTVENQEYDVPSFVRPLYAIVVILYSCFGAVRFISIWKQEEAPRLKSEVAYMVLSLTVKTIFRFVLAARVFV